MDLTPATFDTYLRRAFGQMLEAIDRLGDDRVNERPIGDATNSVAALTIHCCAVVDFWLGHVALGEPSDRDRESEFSRTASVAELHDLVDAAIARGAAYVERLEAGEGTVGNGREFLPDGDMSDASVVLKVLEEMAQHLGHMELTVDVLLNR